MRTALEGLSPSALVAAIRANPIEWWRYLGRSSGATFYDSPQLAWLRTGISNSFVNCVLRTRVPPERVDATIEETLAHFRHLAAMSWWTGPGTQPSDLGTRLLAHGLAYQDGAFGMAVDLLALKENVPTPAGLTIQHVDDTEALEKWSYASIMGFGHPETDARIWFDVFRGLGFDLPLRSYVGIVNGEPAGTSQLFLAAGVAGIYVVATVPEARRRGIGAALTLAPLREARAMGYRIGILHASSMGRGVYRRLGFREYCKMSHYGWIRETGQ